ncbi:hypothetical protein BC937DRAFT_94388 [Endogone sp. FLAS-F59071]|nr:hypothetical protein BC937DRAFT_94388 [Endogone sp. FLAS-F59071]|eukprot:RUS14075.1 hypothetical protein BC937DRAFT_94388 [Endogone sp. FLAS-F59071]
MHLGYMNCCLDAHLPLPPILTDIPAWLRSLRLHKYNDVFSGLRWQDIVKMSDEDLMDKGVIALGARRKMLKVFENVRGHCAQNVSIGGDSL